MDPLMVDAYMFFIRYANKYKRNVKTFNKSMHLQTVLQYSIGYGFEDRDELYEFLSEYMIFLRDEEY